MVRNEQQTQYQKLVAVVLKSELVPDRQRDENERQKGRGRCREKEGSVSVRNRESERTWPCICRCDVSALQIWPGRERKRALISGLRIVGKLSSPPPNLQKLLRWSSTRWISRALMRPGSCLWFFHRLRFVDLTALKERYLAKRESDMQSFVRRFESCAPDVRKMKLCKKILRFSNS